MLADAALAGATGAGVLRDRPTGVASSIELPSALAPFGPGAEALVGLWWFMFWIAAAVFLITMALLAAAVLRRRQTPLETDRVTGEALAGGGNLLILVGGVAVPGVVIVVLMVMMITTGADVRALGGDSGGGDDLVIEVTAFKWWWDVEYPDHEVRTANEIRIPAGQPVEFRLRSADIIHSFWVPQLAGKIDMTPGEENYLRVQADEPRAYRGLCTEYCGVQHANMHFVVEALEPDEFDQWLADRQEPPEEPVEAAPQDGLEVFEQADCVACHTVQGVSPHTELGPDLTDFASRRTLAAGIAENEPEALADWILDPHRLKPGVHMPPSPLDDEELEALISYLGTLE